VLTSHHVLAQCLYGILYVPPSVLALWSLTMAATTDPGSVPMGARPLPSNLASGEDGADVVTERDGAGGGGLRRRRGVRRCGKCDDNYKPGRAHHDSVTGRCVVKMDHFCPWVGNAVGIMNHKVRVVVSSLDPSGASSFVLLPYRLLLLYIIIIYHVHDVL
jgi:palmitoyltransferase